MTETLSNTDKFEKFLLNKLDFINNMLIVIGGKNETRQYYLVERELLEDIIHHYNLFVKREMSTGLGVMVEFSDNEE